MPIYGVEKEKITRIADAIREKKETDDRFTIDQMPDEIASIPKEQFHQLANYSNHCVDGVWVRPDDWDDIESMELPTDSDVLYFLVGTKLSEYPFFRIRPYGSNLKVALGHVRNGVFTLLPGETETTYANGAYVGRNLKGYTDDYIVIRLTGTYIQSAAPQAWGGTLTDIPYAFSAYFNCILMRYGRMSRGTGLNCQSYFIESDNVKDFAQYYAGNTSQTIAVGSAYSGCRKLQRLRLPNNAIRNVKITSFSSMFNVCFELQDVDDSVRNMTSWVTSYVTTISSMFSGCQSLPGDIDVSGWDLTNVTNASNAFYNMRSLYRLLGTDSWIGGKNITTWASAFYNCYSLRSPLTLAGVACSNKNTSIASLFYNCASTTAIDLSGWDLSKVTTVANSIYNCSSLKELNMTGVVMPTNVCTAFNNFIYNTGLFDIVLDGVDFSNATTLASMLSYNYGARRIILRNCVAPSKSLADSSSSYPMFRSNTFVEYLDCSDIDMSIFSSTYMHSSGFLELYRLKDFYPPKHIKKNFSITNSHLLSHDSLIRIINNLDTVTSATTLTLSAANLAKLSDAEKAVATQKGWTLA